jgi:hypothetical protein
MEESPPAAGPRLEIVVAADCPGCAEARRIARDIREGLPDVAVHIVDLASGVPAPDGVVATPTYVLDGRVLFLGNPRADELIQTVRRAARRSRVE